jgi:hypothetical protein
MRGFKNGTLFLAGVALSVTALAPLPAQPQRGGGGRGECSYFADANYQGMRGTLRDGAETPWVGDAWNDRISSVQCDPGCTLEAYEDIDFGGARERFRGNVGFVGPAWNDRVSALRVQCGGRDWARDNARSGRGDGACTVYEHANYQGRRERAAGDSAFVGPAWNDQISSIQCSPGCALEGFEHADYAGLRQVFPGATAFVGPVWNDRISAYRVRCR